MIKKALLYSANYYRAFRQYKFELKKSKPFSVKFFNFWEQEICNMWFYRFIQSRKIIDNNVNIEIAFFSTFGNRYVIDWVKSEIKIFFTGENILDNSYLRYSDHGLSNKNIDLALGFEYLEGIKYIRFPLWILYVFPPESTTEDIIKRCEELSFPEISNRTHFASHVSRGDAFGIRREICESMMTIDKVDCDGIFMHNNDDLIRKYNNSKNEYLKNYKFNICPENTNRIGYVTEKIFQAIENGCIPVYWGSNNNPEPEILNHNAILFWGKTDNNWKVLKTIKKLNKSPDLMEEFMNLPRLLPTASELVISMFNQLQKRLEELILCKQLKQ